MICGVALSRLDCNIMRVHFSTLSAPAGFWQGRASRLLEIITKNGAAEAGVSNDTPGMAQPKLGRSPERTEVMSEESPKKRGKGSITKGGKQDEGPMDLRYL